MVKMKICCLCFNPKTGTVILGCVGILVAVLSLVPHSVLLKNHDFYFREYVKDQRATEARDIKEEDLPIIHGFIQMMWASVVALDVTFIFSSILLIAGVAGEKRFLLIPWLFLTFLTLLCVLIGVLSVMFSLADMNSVIVLFTTAPPIALAAYCWYAVYCTFHLLRQEEESRRSNSRCSIRRDEDRVRAMLALRSTEEQAVISQSSSNSSFASVKDSLQRMVGGTPPPPYETVALESREDEGIEENLVEKTVEVLPSPEKKPEVKEPSFDEEEPQIDPVPTDQPVSEVPEDQPPNPEPETIAIIVDVNKSPDEIPVTFPFLS